MKDKALTEIVVIIAIVILIKGFQAALYMPAISTLKAYQQTVERKSNEK